jgi:hypothetical protein
MNAKAAKRIRYAVRCMFSTYAGERYSGVKVPTWKKEQNRLKAEYKATPFHRRDVHQESHRFVLQVKHGNATRKYPA